jgi:hypothetical protein
MSLELELVWFLVVLGGVITLSWFGKGLCGLSLSYLISLGFIHFWGGLIHALSWYHGGEADFTQLGFDQFAWATTGFALGNFAVAPLLAKRLPAKESRGPVTGLATVALISGVILYGFLRVALSNVPSIGALASCGGSLFIAGVCLFGWEGLRQRNYVRIGVILFGLSLLPFFTIVSAGFLGYGAAAALVVVAFLSCQFRNWMVSTALLSITIYFGFCTFMTYMRDRSDIRDEMWDEDSTFSQRFDRIKKTFTNFERVNFSDQDQLERIESRLNQNDLVGRSVYMLDLGEVRFAEGETFRQAAISMVPRILWPSKPVTAGSPDVVSYFTGVPFAAGTSVGVGQVMEGYINYGTPGVVVLFVIFATVLGVVDARAVRKLRDGDTLAFIVWFVPGIALLQPGGSLVDVGATTAASIVLVQLLKIPFALRANKAAREAREISAARQAFSLRR